MSNSKGFFFFHSKLNSFLKNQNSCKKSIQILTEEQKTYINNPVTELTKSPV